MCTPVQNSRILQNLSRLRRPLMRRRRSLCVRRYPPHYQCIRIQTAMREISGAGKRHFFPFQSFNMAKYSSRKISLKRQGLWSKTCHSHYASQGKICIWTRSSLLSSWRRSFSGKDCQLGGEELQGPLRMSDRSQGLQWKRPWWEAKKDHASCWREDETPI